MFIKMPINNFKLKGNKIFINESIIEYGPISSEHREILESLVSKGAYGSALLTLNKYYDIKSINGSKKYTQLEYSNYIKECNSLMKECVSETNAHNFRPLVNLDGLEIMENANNIARGKGDKLLIEDFRNQKILKEQDITMSSSPSEGWGDDVESLTDEFFDYVDRLDYEIKNARRGSYADIGDTIEDLASAFDNISVMASELSDTFSNSEVNYSDEDEDIDDEGMEDENINEAVELSYDDYYDFEHDGEEGTLYCAWCGNPVKSDFCYIEDESDPNSDVYCWRCHDELQSKGMLPLDESEGTQCSDIAEKKDQNIGRLQKPKKVKKHIIEMFNVTKNHGFKGFRLDDQGHYTRGNYVLINENNKIKAINKKYLK